MKSTKAKIQLLIGTLVFSYTGLVSATEQPSSTDSEASETNVEENEQRVVITGSRIPRTDIETPQPVQIYDTEDLLRSGVNTITEFVRSISINQPQPEGQFGLGSRDLTTEFNLRALGSGTTLTLINGRRVSAQADPNNGESFTDVSLIPFAAVERIEILKDGASAIYGADAIGGVVNIILKSEYDGGQFHYGHTDSFDGGGEENTFDLFWGINDATSTFSIGVSHFDRQPLFGDQRSWLAADLSDRGGFDARSFFSAPPNAVSLADFSSLIDPTCTSIATDMFGDFCAFDYQPLVTIIGETQANSLFSHYESELDDDLTLSITGIYTKKDHRHQMAPEPWFGDTFVGLNGLPYPIVLASHPNNPFGTNVAIAHRSDTLPTREFLSTTESFFFNAALDGYLDEWAWQLSLTHGENSNRDIFNNRLLQSEIQAALFGVGGPNGDQFYNPFANSENPSEVTERFLTSTWEKKSTKETALEFVVTNEISALGMENVGIALGGQFRYSELSQRIDPQLSSGTLNFTFDNPAQGDRRANSIYGELSLPFTSNFEIQLATRFEDYSDFGNKTSPKVAFKWILHEDFLIRGSYAESFRPPTFSELYEPVIDTFATNFQDELRCPVTGLQSDCSGVFPLQTSGNPDLNPETGQSSFVGIVWQVSQSLSLNIETWQFAHEERIGGFSPEYIMTLGLEEQFISRAPASAADIALGIPGPIEQIQLTFLNLDDIEVNGTDFNLQYVSLLEDGDKFEIIVEATYWDSYEFTESINPDLEQNFVGTNDFEELPRWRANLTGNWQSENHGLSLTARYIHGHRNFRNVIVDQVQTNTPFYIEDSLIWDFQYRYFFTEHKFDLSLGCRNCSDFYPEVNTPAGALWDTRGGTWYFNLSHKF